MKKLLYIALILAIYFIRCESNAVVINNDKPFIGKALIFPDKYKPVSIDLPHLSVDNKLGTSLTIKFDTSVVMLPGISINIIFDVGKINPVNADTCTIIANNSALKVKLISNLNTLTCFIEETNSISNNGLNKIVLSFGLRNGFQTNYINSIDLTITENTNSINSTLASNKFSSLAVYNDFNLTRPSLQATVVTVKPKTPPANCQDPCTTLYPFTEFSFVIKLQVNDFLYTKQEAIITVEFSDSGAEKIGDLAIKSEAYSNTNNILEQPIQSNGALGFVVFKGAERQLTNISENLVKGRRFVLLLSGLKTKMPMQSIGKQVIIRVYWKNTLSLISYNAVDLSFPVSRLPIIYIPSSTTGIQYSGVSHSEFNDVYENSAFPLRMVFTVPAVKMNSYVKIFSVGQGTEFSFIPSTCEFDNSEIRTICLSEGKNGFKFKMKPHDQQITVVILIWGIALKCGENRLDTGSETTDLIYDVMYDQDDNRNKKALKFDFMLYAVESFGDSGSLLAERLGVEMYGSCYTNISNFKSENNPIDLYESSKVLISLTKDILLYKEVSDWDLTLESNTSGPINSFNKNNLVYIYSHENKSPSGYIEFGTNTQPFEFPLPTYIKARNLETDVSDDEYSLNPGYVSLTLSKGFIDRNDSISNDNQTCFLRWFSSEQSSQYNISKERSNLDYNLKNLNEDDSTIYRSPIVLATSDLNLGTDLEDSLSKNIFGKNPKTSRNSAFYTNCYQIRQDHGFKVSSIYSYIDFTYKFHRIPNGDTTGKTVVNRVARFVKLYLNSGVFQPAETSITPISKTELIYVPLANLEIALLKLNLSNISDSYNSILVTLLNINLIETDSDFEYPSAQVSKLKQTYGSNVDYPFTVDSYDNINLGMLNYSNSKSDGYGRDSFIVSKLKSNTNSSYYQTFFGSTILITGEERVAFSDKSDILIPVKPPKSLSLNNSGVFDSKKYRSYVNESVIITQVDLIEKRYLIERPKTIHYNPTTSHSVVTHSLVNPIHLLQTYSSKNLQIGFSNYLTDNRQLYLKPLSTVSCDAIILMTSSNIITETEFSYEEGATNSGLFSGVGKLVFSYKNKNYEKMFLLHYQTPYEMPQLSYFTGINRPSMKSFRGFDGLEVICIKNTEYSAIVTSDMFIEKTTEDKLLITVDREGSTAMINAKIANYIKGRLEISSSNIVTETICGYEDGFRNVPCSVDFGITRCSINKESYDLSESIINVCCYNLKQTETLTINANESKFIDDNMFLITHLLKQTVTSTIILTSELTPTIDSSRFIHCSNQSCITSLIINIDLKRKTTPNEKIFLKSNLSNILLNETTCKYTFKDTDLLVSTCQVTNDGIIITNRKFIIKCGYQLASKLTITVTPVLANKLLEYELNSTVEGKSYYGIGKGVFDLIPLATPKELILKPDLCQVIASNVQIKGYTTDLTIKFNTMLNEKTSFNEISFFLNNSIFEILGSLDGFKTKCFVDGKQNPCSIDNGFLNIKSEVVWASGCETCVYNVVITNVKLGNVEVEGNNVEVEGTRLICSGNIYDPINASRTTVIQGFGKFIVSNYKEASYFKGNLIFLSQNVLSSTEVSPLSLTNLHFRFTIDTTQAINSPSQVFSSNSSDTSINETPYLILELPIEFESQCLGMELEYQVEAELFITSIDQTAGSIFYDRAYTPKIVIEINSAVLRNRSITITMKNSLTFTDLTSWIDLYIKNLCTPITQSDTSLFKLAIIDRKTLPTKIFRSYENLNNNSSLKFTFDNHLAYIMFNNNKNIIIKQGRYTPIEINVVGDLSYASAIMQLEPPSVLFQTMNNLEIDTGKKRQSTLFLGVKCGVLPSYYWINFKLSNMSGFYDIVPLRVKIDEIDRAGLTTSSDYIGQNENSFKISNDGFRRIFIRADFLPFEDVLLITSLLDDKRLEVISKDKQVTIKTKEKYSYLEVSFTASNTSSSSDNLKIELTSKNQCFGFFNQQSTIISFTLTNLPTLNKLAESFKYIPFEETKAYNQLQFVYESLENTNLLCEITDLNISYQLELDSQKKQYYKSFNSNSTITIIFDNLNRAQDYQLNCLLELNSIPIILEKGVYSKMITSDGIKSLSTAPLSKIYYLSFEFESKQNDDFLLYLELGIQRRLANSIGLYGEITVSSTLRDYVLGYRSLSESISIPQNYVVYFKQTKNDSHIGKLDVAVRDIEVEVSNHYEINNFVIAYTNQRVIGSFTVKNIIPNKVESDSINSSGLVYNRRIIKINMKSNIPVKCNWKLNFLGQNDSQLVLSSTQVNDCKISDDYQQCGKLTLDGEIKYELKVGILDPGYYAIDAYCSYNLPETEETYKLLGKFNVMDLIIMNEPIKTLPCNNLIDDCDNRSSKLYTYILFALVFYLFLFN